MTRRVSVSGVQGWTDHPQCEAKNEGGAQCRGKAGHEAHDFPMPRLSPEEALATIRELAAAGKVGFATQLVTADGHTLVASEPRVAGGFIIQWQGAIGFGELSVRMNADGTIDIDDECMGREFVRQLLLDLAERAKLSSDKQEHH